MFRKTLVSAILVTLISIPVVFFLHPLINTPALHIGLIFLACLATAALAQLGTKPAQKQRKAAPRRSRADSNAARELGRVKWFNASKGFGFITRDSGDDVFVHFRSIRGEDHRVLKDGQRVEFSVSQGDKGLQADDVSAVED